MSTDGLLLPADVRASPHAVSVGGKIPLSPNSHLMGGRKILERAGAMFVNLMEDAETEFPARRHRHVSGSFPRMMRLTILGFHRFRPVRRREGTNVIFLLPPIDCGGGRVLGFRFVRSSRRTWISQIQFCLRCCRRSVGVRVVMLVTVRPPGADR